MECYEPWYIAVPLVGTLWVLLIGVVVVVVISIYTLLIRE